MSEHSCYLCGEIDGCMEKDLFTQILGGNYMRRVLMESSNFAILPSIGPLAPGHILLCTKAHYSRFADCPTAWGTEYSTMLEGVRQVLSATGASYIHLFEHGSGNSGAVACSIEHAHQHLLPCSVNGPSNLGELGDCFQVPPTPGALKDVVRDQEYLLYSSLGAANATVVLARGRRIQSQWMRQYFAAELGCAAEWDWRVHPRSDVLRATCDLFVSEMVGGTGSEVLVALRS